jgi:nucleotide-binding universal stress UspA family protein
MRLLVPIDGSDLAMRALEHVARFVGEADVVLLHVAGMPPELLEHPGGETPAEESSLERKLSEESRRYREEITPVIQREVFEPATRRLVRTAKGAIRVRVLLAIGPSSDTALNIITEAERGGYDAVVIGRHARSGVMRVLLGGTASKVVHQLQTIPIWLVP